MDSGKNYVFRPFGDHSAKSNQESKPDLQFDTPARKATSIEMNELNRRCKILVLLLIANIAIIAVIGIVYFTVMKKYVGAEVISANDVSPPKSAQEIKTADNYFDSRVPHTTTSGVTDELRLIGRYEWGGQLPTELKLPVPYVIISHTATDSCKTHSECTYRVRFAQTFHMESRGWSDIGYNFLIGGDGNAYVGRGWDYVGAHAYGYNAKSIGISFIGTFNSVVPPQTQLLVAQRLIKSGVKAGKIAPDYKLLAHRQISRTLSPGDALFNVIKTWPHWSPTP